MIGNLRNMANDMNGELENQNNQLKSNVEEKETIVVQNSEELKAIKDERDRLTEQVRSYHTNQSRREC